MREIWVTRIVVNVAHEVSLLRPSDLCCSTGSPSWPGCWSSSCSSCVSRSCPSLSSQAPVSRMPFRDFFSASTYRIFVTMGEQSYFNYDDICGYFCLNFHECMNLRFRREVTIFYSFTEAEFRFCCLFWHSLLRYWCFYYNFIFEKEKFENTLILTSPVPCTNNKLFLFLLFVKNFYVC